MSLILTIVFIMCMFLWFLSAFPMPQTEPWRWVHPIIAWIAVAILGFIVLGGARL